ncbi:MULTISPECIES: ABC-three component system middle component 4 [unclassified Chryseobacterium]|uniref:ABC-three component system middle component 4 n=1 Tax=unclassified Chryseobacterium TaxID=2593645 RepID=UPI00100BE6EA|nr:MULTISPECIES: ABC-three component system middle component 4 [unclassified Chryseobacterium]RXM50005.1 hypothetical protein BOQ64_21030 [Chryseobacterium sp. CH25]RXM62923.1 hypothetical protein BOQ60_18785 [Chryseobacterium sp. CH1]
MKKIPIYIPDHEVNFGVGKLLFLLLILSKSTKKEGIFTLDRIAQFEFISKHPILLNRLLDNKDKNFLTLTNAEKYSIEAIFPNRGQLFDFTRIKLLLNILLSFGFIDIKTSEDFQILYIINEDGKNMADKLETAYFQRLEKVLIQMKPILNMSHSKINSIIQNYL